MSLLTLRWLFERLRGRPLKAKRDIFFWENEAQEMTPKLLALAKVCSAASEISVTYHGICRLYFCAHHSCPQTKLLPFLELTPTLWQMPGEVTNISQVWADFCQCQEFWCHFLSFIVLEKWSFWLWEGALSLSKSPLEVKWVFFQEN